MAPEGPNTARLTVQNATGEELPLDTYEDGKTCSGRLTLHNGVPENDIVTVRISAAVPFTLTARGADAPGLTGGVTYCTVAVTFDPRAGETYLAIYRAGGGKCFLQVGRRTSERFAAKATYVVEPSARQRDEPACR